MIRYSAYDPPEYVNWRPKPQVLQEYRSTLEAHPERRELIRCLGATQLLALYEGLVRNRLHDIALKRWVKQGIISKAWLGTGEEATTIGAVHALDRCSGPDGRVTDHVAPMIRNTGACHEMGMSIAGMFRGYLGTSDSPTRGRDLHIGDFGSGVLTPISPVGHMVPISAGIALSFKLRRERRVALTWIGDGSTNSGPCHEGINFAAALRLPLIVIIQNNQVALGTRLQQYHRGDFLAYPEAYGVEGWGFDGNNVLDAYAAVKVAADRARLGQGPFLLLAETFRMGGHATHDEREARQTLPRELFEHWGERDPIGMYEAYLLEGEVELNNARTPEDAMSMRERNAKVLRQIEERVIQEVDRAAEEALASVKHQKPRPQSALEGVYADSSLPGTPN
ncbi:MAG TPA: thiamine pyrophosphate-dependent dehydrogenase E1 component subunit alpha [Blastocatellia bacterium]|nr:thiamine pyrophosphate-dependent dehydrogenase E1 component subunit alpha [Blastocatellia bacterium]